MAEAKKADKVIALQKYFIDNITAIDTCREEFRGMMCLSFSLDILWWQTIKVTPTLPLKIVEPE